MTGRNNITSRQMALFTFVTQTGIGIITLPSVLAKEVGHDGWISLLISGSIAIVLSVLFVLLLRRYSDKGILDINQLIFGRVLGTFFNILLVIYLILAAVRGVRIFTLFLKLTALPLSPVWAVSPFIMLPSIYLVWQGLKYVARFKYLTLISYITLIFFISLMLEEVRTSFLLPIGEAGMPKILSSIQITFRAFIGLELIVFLFPEITDKKDAFRWHLIANLFSTLFFVFVIATCTAIFGVNLLQVQTIPLFNLARSYHAPIIERVDLYIIALWFVVMGCAMRAYMFAAFYSLEKVFKINKTKFSMGLFFLLLILLSRIPRDINETFLLLDITSYVGIGVSLFFVLSFILSFLRIDEF